MYIFKQLALFIILSFLVSCSSSVGLSQDPLLKKFVEDAIPKITNGCKESDFRDLFSNKFFSVTPLNKAASSCLQHAKYLGSLDRISGGVSRSMKINNIEEKVTVARVSAIYQKTPVLLILVMSKDSSEKWKIDGYQVEKTINSKENFPSLELGILPNTER